MSYIVKVYVNDKTYLPKILGNFMRGGRNGLLLNFIFLITLAKRFVKQA